jgi:hypothetical protein
LLASADPFQIDGEALTLVAAYDFHRDGLNKEDTRKVIEEVVAQVLGRPYRVHCVNQEEARNLGPAPVPAAPVAAATPAPAPIAPGRPAPAPAASPEEPPPWSAPEPAPASPPVQATRPAGQAPAAAPSRPQAHHVRETPVPAADGGGTERYIGALRNIFTVEEIQPGNGELPRPR